MSEMRGLLSTYESCRDIEPMGGLAVHFAVQLRALGAEGVKRWSRPA
jgi:hypothetical protein